MRLHRLDLSAFLAFPGTETVDFDRLGESGLFLVHGRTGAGKTSLLDAVCFAFYGEVPGAREDGASLRSDHAAPQTVTEVVLEATLRGRRLRITRAPEQARPKRRGAGTTTEAHRISVVALGEDGSEQVLATRHDDARRELGDLLGMTKEQFCQVVLLPQGGFARFLHARSDERETLLRELFDVGRFASVERWLKDRRHDAERALAAAMGEVRDTVARAEQESGAQAPDRWTDAPAQVSGWLEAQLVVAEASATTAEGACMTAGERREAAAAELTAARELHGLQTEHAAAQAALAAWEAGETGRHADQDALAAARRAAPAQARTEDLEARLAAENTAEAHAATALAAAREAGVAGDSGSGALRASAAALRLGAGRAEAMLVREREVEAEERALDQLRQRAAGHAEAVRTQATALTAAEARRPGLEADLTAARDATARLEGAEAAARQASAAAVAAAERDELAVALQGEATAHLTAREAALAAQEAHAEIVRRRLDGIAGELAGRLADGEACAVCGSLEHPAPAPAPATGLVGEDDVRAVRERAEAAMAEREARADALAALQTRLAEQRALSGDDLLTALRERAQAAARDHAATRRRAEGQVPAERALAGLARTCEETLSRLDAARNAAAQAGSQLHQRSETLEHNRGAVDAARAGERSVAARVERLAVAADAAAAAADAAEAAERCRQEARRACEGASAAAAEAGFDSVDALRAAVVDAGGCDALERRIRAYDSEVACRRAAAAREDLVAAAGRPVPGIAALEQAAATAASDADLARGTLAVAKRRHGALETLGDRLAAALAAAVPARERLAVARELADLANGVSASNRLRMRLSAYVLAARLEEVAAAATVRLEQMSGGRYALEHTDEGATGRSRGGLDLRVADAWTGRHRAPASLSGGETFLASLALALGLADVVTAEAGGARLETLFVDEGFGSLDDEGTLDEVLAVLDGLRDGGRSVGIVSHVAEMRQRIPVQLRVEKGPAGSHLARS